MVKYFSSRNLKHKFLFLNSFLNLELTKSIIFSIKKYFSLNKQENIILFCSNIVFESSSISLFFDILFIPFILYPKWFITLNK